MQYAYVSQAETFITMSFKCSVFGHAFEDSELEREREEEGSEVVTTIREIQTCARCGESRVVSENKEVTTLETAADIVADDLAAEESPDSPGSPESPDPDRYPDPETDEGEILDDEPTPQPEQATDSGGSIPDAETGTDVTAEAEMSTEEAPSPEEDDGVILEEEEPDPEPAREPGAWPDEPDEEGDDWKPETMVDPTPEEESRIEPTGSAVTVPDGEFHCPECSFTTPVEQSSLRAGDFCPECHRGALEHVTE